MTTTDAEGTGKWTRHDNSILRRAVQEAQRGDVLVVHRGGDERRAAFGGLLGLAAKNRGIAGAVLDGPAADVAELAELGLPVFARGISALTTRRYLLSGRTLDEIDALRRPRP